MLTSKLRRLSILPVLVFLSILLLPTPAQAEPGPDYMDAQTVDAHSILVTWSDDPLAEGYRIYRSNHGPVADVAEDVNEYLDTGLESHTHYSYYVASLINGQVYPANHPYVGGWTLDAPAEITSISWLKLTDYNNHDYLAIQLEWTPVDSVLGYEIFARTGDFGEYTQWTETVENEVSAGFLLPQTETTYWFKVRAYDSYYSSEENVYGIFTGPFSPEVSITVPPLSSVSTMQPKPIYTLSLDDFTIATPTPFPLKPIHTLDLQYFFTPAPTPPPARSTINPVRPKPTPLPVRTTSTPLLLPLPVRTDIIIPLLPTPTPVPQVIIQPIRPLIPITPIRP